MKLKQEIIKQNIKQETLLLVDKYLDFDKVSIRQIAKKCGISLGNFYTYYPSKDVLLMDLMKEHWNKFMFEFRKDISSKNSFDDMIIVLSHNLSHFLKLFSTFFLSKGKEFDDDFISTSKQHHKKYILELTIEMGNFLKRINMDFTNQDSLFLLTSIIGYIKTDYLTISEFIEQANKIFK